MLRTNPERLRLLYLRPPFRAAALLLILFGATCAQPAPPDPPPAHAPGDTPPGVAHFTREFMFVGDRQGVPVVATFQFVAVEEGAQVRRIARAALGIGSTWESFLEESWRSPPATGMWRVLPYGGLRVIAGGATEVEALVFRRGERVLRLQLDHLISTLDPREELQYRLYSGVLEQGGHLHRGSVLEVYRVLRRRADEPEFAGAVDWGFLTDGRQIRLLVAEAQGTQNSAAHTLAWTLLPEPGERAWEQAQLRWLEVRTLEPARRDVPTHWSFEIPGAALAGELISLGSDLDLGPERAGRRAVFLRHTVDGWMVVGEERHRVFGLVRHGQN